MSIFKRSYILLASMIGFCFSCNNQQQQSAPKNVSASKAESTCYRYVNNKDTVILKTKTLNGLVTGTLIYNLYEKDKNTGTIEGKMDGEILLADYTFNSEGTTSERPVAFKKEGNNLIEGFGETENKNGKIIFKNIDSLNYEHSILLEPFDCDE